MHIVVTGGAGYIGSVVSERLLDAGHEVTVYDNLSHGHRDAVPPGAAFEEGDVLDTERVRGVLLQRRVEAVVHAAGLIEVSDSMQRPGLYYRVNLEGGLRLLEAVVAAGVPIFVFSSTAAVYGGRQGIALRETDALGPSSPYGQTKLAFERALHWYGRAHGLCHVSLRYFNAAGATAHRGERHEPETHLIPQLLAAAAGEREDVTIYGTDYPTPDGSCVRDYVHVADLADAHLQALESLRAATPGLSAALNVGYGSGCSVLDVVEAVRRVTRRPVPVRLGPRRPGDSGVLVACADRIRGELGWTPSHPSLEEIVESAWRWQRSRPPRSGSIRRALPARPRPWQRRQVGRPEGR
jgi:UDP-glucose 4-epimerase